MEDSAGLNHQEISQDSMMEWIVGYGFNFFEHSGRPRRRRPT